MLTLTFHRDSYLIISRTLNRLPFLLFLLVQMFLHRLPLLRPLRLLQ